MMNDVYEYTNLNPNSCTLGFSIDCSHVDAENEHFRPGAFDFSRHQKQPNACFGHDRNLVIGLCEDRTSKAYSLDIETYEKTNILNGVIYFDIANPEAMEFFDLAYRGIARGISPGFLEPSSDVAARGGVGGAIKSAELVEITLCYFPENPEASVTWVSKTLRDACEVSSNVMKSIRKHIPEARVSMLLTTKKLKEKEVPGIEETEEQKKARKKAADNKPADDKPAEEEAVPPSAKALDSYHTMQLAMAEKCRGMCKSLDPGTEGHAFLTTKAEDHEGHAEEANDLHGKMFPDREPLKAESEEEHSIPTDEIKHLKELEQGFKTLKNTCENQAKQIEALKINRRK